MSSNLISCVNFVRYNKTIWSRKKKKKKKKNSSYSPSKPPFTEVVVVCLQGPVALPIAASPIQHLISDSHWREVRMKCLAYFHHSLFVSFSFHTKLTWFIALQIDSLSCEMYFQHAKWVNFFCYWLLKSAVCRTLQAHVYQPGWCVALHSKKDTERESEAIHLSFQNICLWGSFIRRGFSVLLIKCVPSCSLRRVSWQVSFPTTWACVDKTRSRVLSCAISHVMHHWWVFSFYRILWPVVWQILLHQDTQPFHTGDPIKWRTHWKRGWYLNAT